MTENSAQYSHYQSARLDLLKRLQAKPEQWQDWNWQIANRATNLDQLERMFGHKVEIKQAWSEVLGSYALGITPHYAALAVKTNGKDPVLAQALPDSKELENQEGLPRDPFRENELSPAPGVVHRHKETVLLLVGHFCPVYCRHCFRKRFFNDQGGFLKGDRLQAALNYIRSNLEIRDVLVTGGEPLVAPDDYLDDLLGQLRKIKHLDLIRIGTRNPVTLPQRFTPELVKILSSHGPLFLVTHFNHAQEFNPESDQALLRLRQAGVVLANQAVLLKGVNNGLEDQVSLQYGLLRRGVRPYYLHHGDLVAGAGHFRTTLKEGIDLARALRSRVSGMAFPWYVLDAPGALGKVPLLGAVKEISPGLFKIHTPDGHSFEYRDPAG